jgi:hypothetical protein
MVCSKEARFRACQPLYRRVYWPQIGGYVSCESGILGMIGRRGETYLYRIDGQYPSE